MRKKNSTSGNDKAKERLMNLRTEYTALSNYFNALIGFRLTLLGFYLAAIGFVIAGNWPIKLPVALLGVLLTLSLYLFELRTRILFHHLSKRAVEIEQTEWKHKKNELPFFSHMFPRYTEEYGIKTEADYYATPIKVLGIITIRWKLISHSFALDLLYVGILLFFIISATLSITNPSSPSITNPPLVTTTSVPIETQISNSTSTSTPILTPSKVFTPTTPHP